MEIEASGSITYSAQARKKSKNPLDKTNPLCYNKDTKGKGIKVMDYKKFEQLANQIKENAVNCYHSLSTDRWTDENGNTYRVEDAGYSRTLCYNGEIYFANYLNEVKKMS